MRLRVSVLERLPASAVEAPGYQGDACDDGKRWYSQHLDAPLQALPGTWRATRGQVPAGGAPLALKHRCTGQQRHEERYDSTGMAIQLCPDAL